MEETIRARFVGSLSSQHLHVFIVLEVLSTPLFWGVLWLGTFSELFPGGGMSAGLAKCSFRVPGMQTGLLSLVHLYMLCWGPT